ncbi:MAG: LPXTG cell wall anchor domain-containing protein [Lachnospiraceae bacterium]
MRCFNCGANLTQHDFCTNCGADVARYKKIMGAANLYYNEGLEKKKSEEKKTATTAGVGAVAVGGAGFLVYRNKKKKIKF